MKQEDLSSQRCKIHKLLFEFICLNQKCRYFKQGGCAKCLMKDQIHYDCDVDDITYDTIHPQKDKEDLAINFERQVDTFSKTVAAFLLKGKQSILNQMFIGNDIATDCAQQFLDCLKDFEEQQESSRAMIISDIWALFEDHIDQNDQPSQFSSSSKNSQLFSNSLSDSKSRNSLSENSFLSSKEDLTSSLNSSRKLEVIKRCDISKEDISLSSVKSYHSSASKASLKTESICQSIANTKGKRVRQFKIESQYIESFCLFETKQSTARTSECKVEGKNSMIPNKMAKDLEKQREGSQVEKNIGYFYLITRCSKQQMSIVDLELQREIQRLSFTHDSEIIQFKQLSDRQVIIFSPRTNYMWIQDIFEESNFVQINFPFMIESLSCDKTSGLVFCSDHFGRISIWRHSDQAIILSSQRVHTRAINMMEYSQGKLITCCEDGSVKEFSFNLTDNSLSLISTIRKEISSSEDGIGDTVNYAKRVNKNTLLVQTAEEFIEIYKDGQGCLDYKEDSHEYFQLVHDMKIYEERYGIFRSIEEEYVICIYDIKNLKIVKTIEINEDKAIIGAYFIHNYLILILDDGYIQFFV